MYWISSHSQGQKGVGGKRGDVWFVSGSVTHYNTLSTLLRNTLTNRHSLPCPIYNSIASALWVHSSNVIALTSGRHWSRRPMVTNDVTGIWHENQIPVNSIQIAAIGPDRWRLYILHRPLDILTFDVRWSETVRRFWSTKVDFQIVVQLISILVSLQASKGNFQKICNKTFYTTCRPRLYKWGFSFTPLMQSK